MLSIGQLLLATIAIQAVWIDGAPADEHGLKPRDGLVSPYIVGGDYVEIEKIPWQVSMQFLWGHYCGAVIIAPKWALTAAHCTSSVNIITKWALWLRAGTKTTFPLTGKKHYLERMVAHPKYDRRKYDFDLGLIEVVEQFQYSNTLKAVVIPQQWAGDDILDYSVNVTVSGWGTQRENGWATFFLKKVDVPLVPRDKCAKAYSVVPNAPAISPRMICAGGFQLGDSCQGDSGGPITQKNVDNQDVLFGVVSWGFGCNKKEFPGVYASILDLDMRSFIKEYTKL